MFTLVIILSSYISTISRRDRAGQEIFRSMHWPISPFEERESFNLFLHVFMMCGIVTCKRQALFLLVPAIGS